MSVQQVLWRCCVVLAIGSPALRAGIITSPVAFPSGNATIVPLGGPPANNDNKVGTTSPQYFASYPTVTFSTSAAPLNVVFNVGSNSGGTREYFFVGTVKNPVGGMPWIGFQLSLSTSSPIPGLDFDWPDLDSHKRFGPVLSPTSAFPTQLLWMTPTPVNPGAANQSLNFSIDVPDAPDSQPYSFTLTLTPLLVPEPASLSCLLLMLAGLARRTRSGHR